MTATELSAFFYRQCHWMLTPPPCSSYYLASLREVTEAQRLRYTDLLFLRLWPVPRAFFFSCRANPHFNTATTHHLYWFLSPLHPSPPWPDSQASCNPTTPLSCFSQGQPHALFPGK